MDILAEKRGMDPFDLRYKNVYREGATTPTGQTPDSWSLPEMFDTLKPKYEAAKAEAAEKYGSWTLSSWDVGPLTKTLTLTRAGRPG